MRALALALLLGCSTSRSAEDRGTATQKVVDEGSFGVEFDFAPLADTPGTPPATRVPRPATPSPRAPLVIRFDPAHPEAFLDGLPEHGPLTGVRFTGKLPVTTTDNVSWWQKMTAAWRFGFSPWQWAIGAVVVAALAYGAFWVKRKLAL